MRAQAVCNRCIDRFDDLPFAPDYSIIGPRDHRATVRYPDHFPFNTICCLERHFGDGIWRKIGTGTLVGPTTLLTAGHCIYHHRLKRPAEAIRVSPGRSGSVMPFGRMIAYRYYVPLRYMNAPPPTAAHPERRTFDYGVIKLPRAFRELDRFMTLRAVTDSEMDLIRRKRLVTIAGYPGDKPAGTMWRHQERIRAVSPQLLRYTVDTCPGQSGSPVWVTCPQTRQRWMIGIHTSGPTDEWGRAYGCFRNFFRKCRCKATPPGLTNGGIRITAGIVEDAFNPDASGRMTAGR